MAFPERNIYIATTPAHNTWTNYSEERDNVKAFFVEVQQIRDGKIYGDIVEIDYERHLDYLLNSTKQATNFRLKLVACFYHIQLAFPKLSYGLCVL